MLFTLHCSLSCRANNSTPPQEATLLHLLSALAANAFAHTRKALLQQTLKSSQAMSAEAHPNHITMLCDSGYAYRCCYPWHLTATTP
jgi:hypothetical protein